jgi:ATP/ADP translocase
MLMNLLDFSFHLLDMDIVLMIGITCLEWILHVSVLNERQKSKMKSNEEKPNSSIQT